MPLSNLLTDLLSDLHDPGMLWQAAAIAVSIALGWCGARLIRAASLRGKEGEGNTVAMGVLNFAHVLSPLLIVALLALAKLVLAKFHINATVLKVAMPIFGSLAVIRAAFYMLRRVFARHGPVGATILTFEKIFALLMWLAVAMYIAGLWPLIFEFLDGTYVPIGRNKASVTAILQGAVSVVVLLMVALWAGAALEERLMGVQGLHSSLRAVMARMSRALLIVVAVLLSLSAVGIDLTVLSVFGGALGVGLGLGMQKIASNYVSGFVILLERSLTIGDMITVDKYYGKVTHINTRYTVLQGLDGVETVLPNEMLISGAVQNQSLSNPSVQLTTSVVLAYDSKLEELLPLLEKLPLQVPRVLDQPAPGVALKKFGNDGFEIELGFWINDPHNGRGGVISEVNKALYALVQSGQIKLAYPARDTRLIDAHIANILSDIAPEAHK
jgi:small-conductance mechanosensitive channel